MLAMPMIAVSKGKLSLFFYADENVPRWQMAQVNIELFLLLDVFWVLDPTFYRSSILAIWHTGLFYQFAANVSLAQR